jgi:putative ABC transport system ATP-binding protein
MSYEYIIEVEHVEKQYTVGGTTFKALDGIDLRFGRGEYTSLVGPSGSGKTTLFNMIG